MYLDGKSKLSGVFFMHHTLQFDQLLKSKKYVLFYAYTKYDIAYGQQSYLLSEAFKARTQIASLALILNHSCLVDKIFVFSNMMWLEYQIYARSSNLLKW